MRKRTGFLKALKARAEKAEKERDEERATHRAAEAELAARAEDAYAKRDTLRALLKEARIRFSFIDDMTRRIDAALKEDSPSPRCVKAGGVTVHYSKALCYPGAPLFSPIPPGFKCPECGEETKTGGN